LAEAVLCVPHAGGVRGARALSTVAGETRGRPAARRVVLGAVTVPAAHAVVVTGDFGLPVVASTSTSVVVVEDGGPLRPLRVAHVTKSVARIATGVVVQVGAAPRTERKNPRDGVALRARTELQDDEANLGV
jgi:hypothetical protein